MTPLPDEIDAILDTKCRMCHSRPTHMYAPMSLMTWEDLQAPFPGKKEGSTPVYELAEQRIHDARAPMPPVTQPQLSDEERGVIDAWVAQCAPAKKE